MTTPNIKTTKIAKGEYMIERDDGEQFRVFRSLTSRLHGRSHHPDCPVWIIERQTDLALTDEETLRGAKYSIMQKWDAATK